MDIPFSEEPDQENPFRSPQADRPSVPATRDAKYAQLGRLMVRWEKLRIVYNTVLIAVVLLSAIAKPGLATDLDFLGMLVFGCLGANLCFLLGPFIDGYLSWIGLRHRAVTLMVFIAGTGLAVLLALGAMFSFALEGLD